MQSNMGLWGNSSGKGTATKPNDLLTWSFSKETWSRRDSISEHTLNFTHMYECEQERGRDNETERDIEITERQRDTWRDRGDREGWEEETDKRRMGRK